MNLSTRVTIVACCCCLCGGAAVIARLSEEDGSSDNWLAFFSESGKAGDYQHVASEPASRLDFSQFEAIILRAATAKSQRARVEFGSAKIEQGNALVEVLFFSPDGKMQPYLYKLTPAKDSWKVASVQRMWYVPRSRLLRGMRA